MSFTDLEAWVRLGALLDSLAVLGRTHLGERLGWLRVPSVSRPAQPVPGEGPSPRARPRRSGIRRSGRTQRRCIRYSPRGPATGSPSRGPTARLRHGRSRWRCRAARSPRPASHAACSDEFAAILRSLGYEPPVHPGGATYAAFGDVFRSSDTLGGGPPPTDRRRAGSTNSPEGQRARLTTACVTAQTMSRA